MKMNVSKVLTMVVAMLFFCVSFVSMAEEEKIIVYAEVPSDWNEPHVWAWGEDGTSAFDAWPGGKMLQDENNEGWYYLHVPSWVTSVIINANEGTVQTADLATNTQNSWISVSSPEEAVLTNDQMTEGELPEHVEMIVINAMVPDDWTMPNLWAWSAPDGTNVFANWPGQEMVEQTDGWYTYEVPAWVNSVIVNANLGEIQTSDLSIEGKDTWIVIEDTETVSVSYEKPVLELSEEDLITIRAIAPEDWLLPSLWAWSAPDGTNVYPNWPGEEMVEEDGWMTMSVPNWVNSIIINGNLGAVQTADISIEAQDVWVVVKDNENYEVFYEEPVLEEVVTVDENDEAVDEIVDETVDEKTENVTKEGQATEEPEESNNIAIYIVVIVGVLVAIGAVLFVIKKKR